MDFLEIRKKAGERAAASAAPDHAGAASSRGAVAAPPPGLEPGSPAADGAAEAPPDASGRFTTWRPGDGAPPLRLEEERAPPVVTVAGPAPAFEPERATRPACPLDAFFYRADEEAPDLPGVDGDGAVDLEPGAAPLPLEEYLTFLLGEEAYGVAMARVREVLRAPPVTEVPRAPADVLGVVTIRGEIVAVVDPRRALGLPRAVLEEGAGRVVVVDAGEGPCGLLVDRVASVVRLPPGAIEPCQKGLSGARADCLAGIGRERDRLFTVVDVGALLARAAPAPHADRRPRAGA
jgi:purine-binding chemotaxis protein CheW